jgi:hypothetical protein
MNLLNIFVLQNLLQTCNSLLHIKIITFQNSLDISLLKKYHTNTMALPSHCYSDPLRQLLEKENRSCKGCSHLVKLWGVEVCAKHERIPQRRCLSYTILPITKDTDDGDNE